jgi:hypothetical protein
MLLCCKKFICYDFHSKLSMLFTSQSLRDALSLLFILQYECKRGDFLFSRRMESVFFKNLNFVKI